MVLDRMLRDIFIDAEVLFTLRMVVRKSGVTDSSIRYGLARCAAEF